ncbi:ABC transporter transmembrane protein [Phyllobacterium leguminum]|uniref:ABC transporter transmembrane protein n=1 Tax=Phyllobacterium leguminum TaxID=314237 RepID=A0A318SYQ6_9HYPH|nr:ABC transporter transmembrane protein [Phyllobacterium leguminum]
MNENQSKPALLSWFTKSTFRYTPYLVELAVIAIVLRLLGLVQPFVFQAIIDRVLPFQREATLSLIVVILIATTIFSATLSALAAYLGNHMAAGHRIGAAHFYACARSAFAVSPALAGGRNPRPHRRDRHGTRFPDGNGDGHCARRSLRRHLSRGDAGDQPIPDGGMLVTLPLEIATFSAMGPLIRRRMQEAFLAGSRHQARLVETLGNDTTVKALASERLQTERFQETLRHSIAMGFRVTKLNILNGFIGDILGSASNIITIYIGCQLVFRNEITLGQLIAFNMLAGYVSGPIMSLSSLMGAMAGAADCTPALRRFPEC